MPIDRETLEAAILRYAHAHELAAETAVGVHKVWLSTEGSRCSTRDVEQALDRLASAGLLERHTLPGGEAIYRVPRTAGG